MLARRDSEMLNGRVSDKVTLLVAQARALPRSLAIRALPSPESIDSFVDESSAELKPNPAA
jgi:hypothetical protein